MRAYRSKKSLFFAGLLVVIMLFGPLLFFEGMRVRCCVCLAPFWKVRARIAQRFEKKQTKEQYKIERLQTEKHLLLQKCQSLQSLFDHQQANPHPFSTLGANVIFRDPATFHSTLWIDVGQKNNEVCGQTIVAPNSCVLVGRSVVGVVDYVGKKQSRVRLITDRKLQPSVRAARGQMQNRELIVHLQSVVEALQIREDLPLGNHTRTALTKTIQQIEEHLVKDEQTLYLAKGYLQGASAPLWRRSAHLLKGVGFNYDFKDDKGSAAQVEEKNICLIQEGDLLVTTGMDGVFPADLFVATVCKVFPLKEGDVSYSIEAKPYATNLDSLRHCTVIAPLHFDASEKPFFP